MTGKRLLVLGGADKALPLLRSAKKIGHFVVLCDHDPTCPGRDWSDAFEMVSTLDRNAILEVARIYDINAVLSFGSDIMAVEAAWLAEELGLPGNPLVTVETMVRKDLFRTFLDRNGFPVPASLTVMAEDACDWTATGLRLPVMVKPVDGAGSTAVRRVDNWRDLGPAFAEAKSASRAGKVIIEEYVARTHGPMIGGDIFVQDGKVVFWGLLDSHRSADFAPFVPTGTSYPVSLDEERLGVVKAHLQRLISALDYRTGPINVELMFGTDEKLYTIELAPRNGGNDIPRLLEMATGYDLIAAMLGNSSDTTSVDKQHPMPVCLANAMVFSERSGTLREVKINAAYHPYVTGCEMTRKPGERVERFDCAINAIGVIWLQFAGPPMQNLENDKFKNLFIVTVN